jgi:hypothetical protein
MPREEPDEGKRHVVVSVKGGPHRSEMTGQLPAELAASLMYRASYHKDGMRRIVCAANRYLGKVVLGARHFDERMVEQIRDLGLKGRECEQGFIDQYGVFMTRKQAWPVALVAGQIIRRVGGDDADGGTLYSENLY